MRPVCGLFLGLAFTGVCRSGLGEPSQDTADARQRVASLAPEQRFRSWAAKAKVELSYTVAAHPSAQPVAEFDGARLRNPASVSKLATAYVALKRLGAGYRFRTTVHGRIDAGHANAIAIRSQGDPTLSSEFVIAMAARLADMGLTAVDGDIVVDQSFFDDSVVPPAFEQQPAEWAAFRAPVCATAVDRNALTVRLLPRQPGENAILFAEPSGAVSWSGKVQSSERQKAGNHVEVSVVGGAERAELRVAGAVDAGASSVALTRRADDPRKAAGLVLRAALLARGVKVARAVAMGGIGDLPVLYAHQSDSLSIIVNRLGKESDNFTAEMLLKAFGARVYQEGSSQAGLRVMQETLEQAGLSAAEMRWVNASGLFDANRVSTNLLVRLLGVAASDPTLAPEYFAQLSVAGRDGTLALRMPSLPAGCVVRAKSGTLRNVISLAGYVERAEHQRLTFAIIIENVNDQSAARQQIDKYVTSLCSAPV